MIRVLWNVSKGCLKSPGWAAPPRCIRSDNGPGFVATAVQNWVKSRQTTCPLFRVHFIQRYGQVRLDNNLIENAIRPSAVGKKNFLFIGSPEAGQRSAIIYSIIVSCERHGIDPLAYMTDLLHRLPAMSNQDDLDPLLPANWKEAL